MDILFFILIVIACLLLILAVLAQHPKSGMAANFGASNQVMGVRQTTDFLEKFTWGTAIAIVIFSLAISMSVGTDRIAESKSAIIENFETESALENANQLQAPLTVVDSAKVAE